MSEASSVEDEYGFPIDPINVDALMVFNFKHKEQQPKIDEEWNNLLKKSSNTTTTKWKDLIVKRGVPKEKRIQIWMTVSGALKHKQNADANNGGENSYLDLVRKNKKKKLDSFAQVDKDLYRTFAEHPRFQTGQMLEALRRVCEAYARKNKAIGYCQSMSYIVGRLLLVAKENEETDVFWLLCSIVEDICVGYYNISLIGTQIEQRVVEELIATHNPELYRHIQELSVSLPLIVTKWVMCIFATSLPSECVYRVWDLMFAYGSFTIPRVCFAIFRILEPQLLKTQDATSFCRLVDQEVSKMFDFKVIRKAMMDRDFKEATHEDNLVQLRQKHTTIVEHEVEQIRQNRNIFKLSSLTHFTRKELQELSNQFKILANKNKENSIKRETYITFTQFSQVMKKNFARLEDDDIAIEQLFKAFDADGDNTIDFRELMIGLSILTKGSFDERLELCFKSYDLDNSGYLDKGELEKMIMSVFKQTLNTAVGGLSVAKYVDVVFLNLDSNKDGQLSFEEFKRVAVIEPQLVQCFLGDEKPQAGNNNEEEAEPQSPVQAPVEAPAESPALQPAEPKPMPKSEAKIKLVDSGMIQNEKHHEAQPLLAPKKEENKSCCCVIV